MIAVHANPERENGMDILSMLPRCRPVQNAPKPEPTFAVLMTPRGTGEVRLGDEVVLVDHE